MIRSIIARIDTGNRSTAEIIKDATILKVIESIQTSSQQTFVFIRLYEDVLKMFWRRILSLSSEDVFKTSSIHLDQDEYIRLIHTSSEDAFKTSWRCLNQDQYNRLGHSSSRRLQYVLQKRLQDIFKTSSRRFQDVFKTSSRRLELTPVLSLQIKLKKSSARKYVWHCFWKDERSWWESKQNECLWWSSSTKGSLKNMLWEISRNSQESISARISLVFSCQFCGICKNTFSAEQHRTTASDYSSINSNEGAIGKRNCCYDTQTKAYVLTWARSVSY